MDGKLQRASQQDSEDRMTHNTPVEDNPTALAHHEVLDQIRDYVKQHKLTAKGDEELIGAAQGLKDNKPRLVEEWEY